MILAKKIYTLLLPVIFSAFQLYATGSPSLNAQCPYSLRHPENATGVIFDESCQKAYIFPPQVGTAEISALAPSTNLGFCRGLQSLQESTKTTMDTMNHLSQKIKTLVASYQPLEEMLITFEHDQVEAKIRWESAKEKLARAEQKLEEMRQELRQMKKDHEDCVLEESMEHKQCLELYEAWQQGKIDIKTYRKEEYRPLDRQADDAAEDFRIKEGKSKLHRNRYIEAIAPLSELQERIISINIKSTQLYHEYTKLEGATGTILWSIAWDRLLRAYKNANPDAHLQWLPLPLKEAQLLSTLKADSGQELSAASIKSANIIGIKPMGLAGMGKGDKIAGLPENGTSSHQASSVFGNSLSGQIVLTLAGACPIAQSITDSDYRSADGLTAHMLTNLIYSYEVASRRSYTANYNLSQFLRKIESKTHSGGFFSTYDAHDLIENNDSYDWFSIRFNANESGFNYSDSEQRDITRAVKSELMDRAYRQFAVLYSGSSLPPRTPYFSQSGADRATAALSRCWHWYCQASVALLGIADGIWGHKSAVSNFHRNNSAWATEHVNGIRFVERSGSLAFKANQ